MSCEVPDHPAASCPGDEERLTAEPDDAARSAKADGKGARGLQCRQACSMGSTYDA